jgi:ubiquinol-cytochrome c reductase cytochrome b subunit
MSAASTAEPAFVAKTKTGRFTDFVDSRVGGSGILREFGRKVFPDHWSFMFGEVALYSFVILLLSGTFLTFFFDPSMAETHYDGSYVPLKGVEMSVAYNSSLDISFDVRGGLFMRQVHHWAALLFVASIAVHMLRVFFTGAFRRPREMNWVVGGVLLILAMAAGFTGYSLPDDLLSGNGLRIIDGVIKSIPVIGTYISFFLFGGEFPGTAIIGRLYMLHILLVPALILLMIVLHLFMVVVHKHTQYPGPGRNDNNVVGYPLGPVYAAKAGGFFFIVFGVVTLMGALMQINPVWVVGPYNPAEVSAGSQPDWYMGFVEGGIRIMPNWESHIGSTTWSWNVMIPGLGLMGLMFGLMAIYPFVEAWVTGDKSEHHILDRPRNAPTRTAFGVAAMTGYAMLWIGGGNDIVATTFNVSLNAVTYFLRVAVFVAPVIAFMLTKRICIGLQRADADRLLHGAESGVIDRDPSGRYAERHRPISVGEAYTLTQHKEHLALEPITDTEGMSEKEIKAEQRRRKATRFFFIHTLRKPTRAELEEAAHHHDDGHGDGNGHAVEGNGNGHHAIAAGTTQNVTSQSQ